MYKFFSFSFSQDIKLPFLDLGTAHLAWTNFHLYMYPTYMYTPPTPILSALEARSFYNITAPAAVLGPVSYSARARDSALEYFFL